MICNKCKKDIPDNSEFCPYCGENLKEETNSKSETKTQEAKENSKTKIKDDINSEKTENISNEEANIKNNPNDNLVCKKCKKELQPNFKRCPYCGTKIKEDKPKINKDILKNKKLIIVLLGIIGVLLIVSTVFITLYFSSIAPYTAEIDSDGYTKYIYNTNSKIYHISEDCVAVKRMKNKKVLWTNVDFIAGKNMEFYDKIYEPCFICAC